MKIIELKATKGPNYWSAWRHRLIVMKLDIGELENLPTNKIPDFAERLEKMFPSMIEHRCSENCEGGFFSRVKEGTWMGHVIEHIALEIQTLAGMDTGFGRTRSTDEKGVYNVVFAYEEEKAGYYAAKSAVRIAEALVYNEEYDLERDLEDLRDIHQRESLGPSTMSLVNEARKRGIPYSRLNSQSLVMLGQGVNQKRIQATIASTTSNLAVDIAGDKEATKKLLESAAIPVPKGEVVYSIRDLEYAIEDLGFPIVIKPVDGNHGRGASINIKDMDAAIEAFDIAQEISDGVIVEKYICGYDFRLLVVNYKLVAAAKRTPAAVIGDGVSTIQKLIDVVNTDPRRGDGHTKVLTQIKIDADTLNILKEKNLTLDSVLIEGEELFLKKTANLSTGGTATDVTDLMHPYNVAMAERIAATIGLDICGIDIMASDLSTPLNENGGAVLEVNAGPGFRMHLAPSYGTPRNVAKHVIDMLFPEGSSATIPVIAVTGTNGKTTTTRLISHIAKTAGKKVGFTTTDGVYIQDKLVQKGDCTGPLSAQIILKDPTVDFAVLECARGGILRGGLGFSSCNVGIITNVSEDHLGLGGIADLKDMARVKRVVAETVAEDGFAILNADDDLVYDMREDTDAKIVLFSLDANSERILAHTQNGGLAAVVENEKIYICKGAEKIEICSLVDVPLTISGKASFMTQNVLPAVITAYVQGFQIDHIRQALKTFIPSPQLTPGRLNIFNFENFKVMIDYAHNAAGITAVGDFLSKIKAETKVGIIAGIGDRRTEDIINAGNRAAQIFDEIIIRLDKDLRGRTAEELIALVKEGIHQVKPEMNPEVIIDELKAISYCIENAKPDSFITVLSERVTECLKVVTKYQEEYRIKEAMQTIKVNQKAKKEVSKFLVPSVGAAPTSNIAARA